MRNTLSYKAPLLYLFLCFLLNGCAKSTHQYEPPNVKEIRNSLHINPTTKDAWGELNNVLSEKSLSFRDIDTTFIASKNIHVETTTITYDFISNHPDKYVDCGESKNTFSNLSGKQIFKISPIGTGTLIGTSKEDFNPHSITRNSNLSGILKIKLNTATDHPIVTINAEYTINVVDKKSVSKNFNDLTDKTITIDNNKYQLSTNTPFLAIDSDIECIATGIIEGQIIEQLSSIEL